MANRIPWIEQTITFMQDRGSSWEIDQGKKRVFLVDAGDEIEFTPAGCRRFAAWLLRAAKELDRKKS